MSAGNWEQQSKAHGLLHPVQTSPLAEPTEEPHTGHPHPGPKAAEQDSNVYFHQMNM